MKVNWLWLLVGVALAMFVIPWLQVMLGRSKVATTKSRGA